MKRPELIICSVFLTTILWVASAPAFDMPVQGKWWHDQRMISTLNLSQEQSRQIEEIFSSHRKEFLEFSTLLKRRYLKLENYLQSRHKNEIDPKRLEEIVEAIQAARSKLEKSRLMMLIEVRGMLTRKQNDVLMQMRREMMRHMGQMGMGRGGHMGGMGKQDR